MRWRAQAAISRVRPVLLEVPFPSATSVLQGDPTQGRRGVNGEQGRRRDLAKGWDVRRKERRTTPRRSSHGEYNHTPVRSLNRPVCLAEDLVPLACFMNALLLLRPV